MAIVQPHNRVASFVIGRFSVLGFDFYFLHHFNSAGGEAAAGAGEWLHRRLGEPEKFLGENSRGGVSVIQGIPGIVD